MTVLYEDEHLLVVDKPAGCLSVPGRDPRDDSLPARLAREGRTAIPVHRLDREVSGALVCARDERTAELLEDLFRERAVEKVYWALAAGRVRTERGAWLFPILEERDHARVSAQGRPAQTRYRVLADHPSTTELEIELVTGRRNQIRIHAAHAGHPLVGERKYARGKDSPLRLRSRRVALHAWRVSFRHPRSDVQVAVEAPLPSDLTELRRAAAAG